MSVNYLQFLFYARPPNSQLLFNEPGIGPFFGRFWWAPLPPKPPEEIDLAETRFFGVQAWPRGPRSPCHLQKITCKEVSGPWKFRANPSNGSQVTALFWSDTRTDRRTQGQKRITSVPLQNFFFACMWVGRRETLQNLPNFYLFTLWRITVCNAWFWAW